MLGSHGTRPHASLHPLCPYGMSLGWMQWLQTWCWLRPPAQCGLVQRSLQTLSKHPAAYGKDTQEQGAVHGGRVACGAILSLHGDSYRRKAVNPQPSPQPRLWLEGLAGASSSCALRPGCCTSLLECPCSHYPSMQVRSCAVRVICD